MTLAMIDDGGAVGEASADSRFGEELLPESGFRRGGLPPEPPGVAAPPEGGTDDEEKN
jgi:hypothetical protein